MFKLISFLVVLIGASTGLAAAGGNGSGGGSSGAVTAMSLRSMIEGDYLKNAMLHYLRTVVPDLITDQRIRSSLIPILTSGELETDIRTSTYRLPSSGCRADDDPNASASTIIGRRGGEICFDESRLLKELVALSVEEQMIRLASLAFHEHLHHFQKPNSDTAANESEAYHLAAYVQLTARTTQIPVLEWNPPGTGSSTSSTRCVSAPSPLTTIDQLQEVFQRLVPEQATRLEICAQNYYARVCMGELWDGEPMDHWLGYATDAQAGIPQRRGYDMIVTACVVH